MRRRSRFDTKAKAALAKWPNCSTKLWPASAASGAWLRAQPVTGRVTHPRLKEAGTRVFLTQPDGLWVFMSPSGNFADCIAVEVSGNQQNLADKRSRYAPSTTATVLDCPRVWLRSQIARGRGARCRWQLAGFDSSPTRNVELPVRFLRVLFFLKHELYKRWCAAAVPAPHEFVAAYGSIKSYNSQKMQEFLRRMTPDKHFYSGRLRP